jgi:hypothetical protein
MAPHASTITSTGSTPPPPLGWPQMVVDTVHEEYFTAQAYNDDAEAGFGTVFNVAKSPELRETATAGLSYVTSGDLVAVAPLTVIVANDAGDGTVTCAWLQVSGAPGLPPGGLKYQGVYKQADAGPVAWDWVRGHDDS